jgi:hypothetical protein
MFQFILNFLINLIFLDNHFKHFFDYFISDYKLEQVNYRLTGHDESNRIPN